MELFGKKKDIDGETSRRITALRFILMVLVVLIHANLKEDDALNYYHLDFVQPAWIGWLKNFVCGSLGGAAVPLFFFFSAYLQFRKNDRYPVLLKKRARTLLVPYMAWTLLTVLLYFAAQSIPQTAQFFANPINIVRNWRGLDWLKIFTYHNLDEGLRYPLVYQFWFLRDLMIFIVLSPLLRLVLVRFPAAFLALCAAYLCGLPVFITPSTGALFFYCAGLLAAEKDVDFFALSDRLRFGEYLALIAFVELVSAFSSAPIGALKTALYCLFWLKVSRFIIQSGRAYAVAERLSGYSFFLYAVHTPFLGTSINKLSWQLIPLHGLGCLAQFVAAGLLTILLGTVGGIVLKRICPRAFALLSGGR